MPKISDRSTLRPTRRRFIKSVATAAVGPALVGRSTVSRTRSIDTRPNILLLITDQQSWNMMGCSDNRWLKTPAMDRLAASGIRFEKAYVTNPVCSPSRFSLLTGRMPSAAGINDNDDAPMGQVSEAILDSSLGRLFSKAGYDTVYGGKIHLPQVFRDEFSGRPYQYIEQNERGQLAAVCAAYLRGSRRRPFFLTASLVNPHDICYVAINAYRAAQGNAPIFDEGDTSRELLKTVHGIKDRAAFFAKDCPPLAANHGIPALEPQAITERYVTPYPFRAYVRQHWSDEDWRIHSWIYHRLTEQVDDEINSILTALKEAGLERDTLVVLTSDHGDLNGAHKLEHKSVLYEEAMRVPFILSYRGVIPEGQVDKSHLVSTGLDLLPTLCDFADIEMPPLALDGLSVRALAERRRTGSWRDYLVVESQRDRMLRTERFKYCLYRSGAHREQLNDLTADPGEMNNLAELPAFKETVYKHRGLLWQWMRKTWDSDGMSLL